MIYAVEGRKCTLCAVCRQYLYWWYLGGAKNAREGRNKQT
jgi:hypothetical protein